MKNKNVYGKTPFSKVKIHKRKSGLWVLNKLSIYFIMINNNIVRRIRAYGVFNMILETLSSWSAGTIVGTLYP